MAEINGSTSDGYHTFDELYEHRTLLFIVLGAALAPTGVSVWMSENHSDGTRMDGWFVMGIGEARGSQITYHLPMRLWDLAAKHAKFRDKAPEWDGHTSDEVLKRLRDQL